MTRGRFEKGDGAGFGNLNKLSERRRAGVEGGDVLGAAFSCGSGGRYCAPGFEARAPRTAPEGRCAPRREGPLRAAGTQAAKRNGKPISKWDKCRQATMTGLERGSSGVAETCRGADRGREGRGRRGAGRRDGFGLGGVKSGLFGEFGGSGGCASWLGRPVVGRGRWLEAEPRGAARKPGQSSEADSEGRG